MVVRIHGRGCKHIKWARDRLWGMYAEYKGKQVACNIPCFTKYFAKFAREVGSSAALYISHQHCPLYPPLAWDHFLSLPNSMFSSVSLFLGYPLVCLELTRAAIILCEYPGMPIPLHFPIRHATSDLHYAQFCLAVHFLWKQCLFMGNITLKQVWVGNKGSIPAGGNPSQ